ncbi:uncharacterized protein LOC130729076 [Lotus japonicus]|uniref:uncharacterized protein LOC130729076 n=1 Tax=Lotus japonicus TaxID=34305 RepID=UPI00258D4D3A|nr:uncharacterized protein LOC130729076 [Lotus japonicus]
MSNHEDDLDLLLSLDDQDQERVLETPPGSPSPGYLTDSDSDGAPNQRDKNPDMSVFRNAVQDCLLSHSPEPKPKPKSKLPATHAKDSDVEKFSGLRIRDQLLTPAELRDSFSDIRFVRLPVIKNLFIGDSFSGSWATVGVLTEKGIQRTSSSGKGYCIWKIGCLDENTVSLFLFGDAYLRNKNEQAGAVFALFDCSVRKDAKGNGFSLSIYSPSQIKKMGTSVDYGVCKGGRADGMACTMVINKRHGAYCKFHKSKTSEKYSTTRTELKGGNLRTAFRPRDQYLRSEGIFVVDPLADKTNLKKSQPVKLMSVDGLRKALSNAGKVTTTIRSQGIRFLSEVAGNSDPKITNKGPKTPKERRTSAEKRKSSFMNVGSSVIRNQQFDVKRKKTDGQDLVDKTTKSSGKMIELDFVSSDEDF